MRQLKSLAIVSLTLLASIAGAPKGAPAWKGRVLSRKYGFSMGSPRGWTAGLDKDDLPVFINFPTSPPVPQQVLPKGGAAINVVAKDSLPGRRMREMTMAEWADFTEQAADRASLVASALDMPSSTGASNAMMASFDLRNLSLNSQGQHEAAVYWEFHGKLFAAYLFYVIGDPKAAEYSDLLVKLVRSIRPA
jgi:hypothetical protein